MREASLDVAPKCQFGRQELDGDGTLQPAIFRAVDDAHPTAPNLRVQLVVIAKDALDMRAKLGVCGGNYWVGHSRGSGSNTYNSAGQARMWHSSTQP